MKKLIMTVLFLFPLIIGRTEVLKTWNKEEIRIEEINKAVDFNYVYEELEKLGCEFPLETTCQIILESGWNFDSNIAKNQFNIIGMRLPNNRKTTASGENGGYAIYNSYINCLKDMVLWQEAQSRTIDPTMTLVLTRKDKQWKL